MGPVSFDIDEQDFIGLKLSALRCTINCVRLSTDFTHNISLDGEDINTLMHIASDNLAEL